MATIQIRIDDTMKMAADDLFNSLGLDISTAVRIFLAASINNDGIPFNIKRTKSVDQAMSDEDIIGISNRIMKKNEEAYKVLAQ
ncbi:MAG: type II toxin-antitoxin system RelB/DinJ family antitoxin [Lachnospiraceae bacterium]|nr:type II toxin-antitoxin system RelB/DinJ family antitoxin [Lachnospiraceae bacterium]